MDASRRKFLKMLAGAGIGAAVSPWFLEALQTYAQQRLAFSDVRGPGITTFATSVCRQCANHCALAVRRYDGLPVGLRGVAWDPASRGALCMAGQSLLQHLFDPDRLQQPLVREDAAAVGRPVAWQEGFELLASRIETLVREGRGKELLVVDGRTPSLGTLLLASWVESIEGARYVPLRIEHGLDRMVQRLLATSRPGRTRIDLPAAGTLVLVGHELLGVDGSPVTQTRAISARRKDPRFDHMPLIFIGPRQDATAMKADIWLSCQPGQERDILLALAEEFSRQHPDRHSILAPYARLIPEARDNVDFARTYAMESVSRRLAIPLEDLRTVWRAMESFPPGLVLPGPSLLRRSQGAADAEAALALNLWTGGVSRKGGLSWAEDPLRQLLEALGAAQPHPPAPSDLASLFRPLLEIKRSPVDTLLCVQANLAHELGGTDQIRRALSHVPFVASLGCHEDEMSRLSHVTLPLPMELESWDLPAPPWGDPDDVLRPQRQAVVPVTDLPSVEDIVLRLGARGVRGDGFRPTARNSKEWMDQALRALTEIGSGEGVGPEGRRSWVRLSAGAAARDLAEGRMAWTRPARSLVERVGARQPQGVEPLVPVALPDLAPDQLWLVAFDAPAIQSGRTLNRPMMMELSGHVHGVAWDSWLEIHPRDAARRGIENGARVQVRGPRAEISLRAVVTRSVVPGVVAAPVGFGHTALGRVARGRGGNPLRLPHTEIDETTGAPAWGPVPVFLEKA